MRLDTRSSRSTVTTTDSNTSSLTDEELVTLFKTTGDSWAVETLLIRYRSFARAKARSYFLQGGDHEDIIQEGMIGLFKAIRDYRSDRQSSFRSFAELCISRQIITAIKTATRQKHIPLNSYVSIHKPVASDDESNDRSLGDMIGTLETSDPLEILVNTMDFASLKTCFDEILSSLEGEVLLLYLDGKTYQEIAEYLGRQVKSIDNALQRIKRKIEMHLVARAEADTEAAV